MSHALTTHLGASYLNAATLAHDALEAHTLVLTARAFPVLGGTKDLLAVQAVLLRLQRTIVDGLRLLHLATGPAANILGTCEGDAERVEVTHIEFCVSHLIPPLPHR